MEMIKFTKHKQGLLVVSSWARHWRGFKTKIMLIKFGSGLVIVSG